MSGLAIAFSPVELISKRDKTETYSVSCTDCSNKNATSSTSYTLPEAVSERISSSMTQELGSLKLVQGSSVKHDSGGSSNFSKNSGSPKLNYDSRRISKNQSLHLDDPSVVKEVENDSLPTIDTPEACDKAARRLRWVLQRLDNGGMSVELLRNNLQYAARVLETVSVREMKRSVEEDDEFSEVQTNAVPIEVREWLASTFTRQVGSTKCKMDEKPKFRSVAQAIRAGIFVERITRKVTNYNLMQFPPEVLKVFKGLDDWSFNTFSLNDVAQGTPLKYLGYDLLNRYGIIRKFKIPPQTLENFLTRIEEGYCQHKNPYHNNIHAADVTQTMHYILSKAGLTNWLTELEIFASLVAAIIHDYQHTGTTNNFHVMAGSDTALLYNDRAVLENHHVSASFRIMKEEEFNILRNLSKEDYRKFRSLVIDMVLATDMSFHFQQLKNMKTLLAVAEPVVDKSKVISLVLHCCDISHPSKKWDLHYRWTMQLLEEFFRQGDMEQELGLPFSPLCDRKNTLVAESQIGFIEFIVEPSMQICGDVLDFVLAPLNKKDNIDDTASSDVKRFRILRPWNQCLVENKKLWKEEALRVAALQPAA